MFPDLNLLKQQQVFLNWTQFFINSSNWLEPSCHHTKQSVITNQLVNGHCFLSRTKVGSLINTLQVNRVILWYVRRSHHIISCIYVEVENATKKDCVMAIFMIVPSILINRFRGLQILLTSLVLDYLLWNRFIWPWRSCFLFFVSLFLLKLCTHEGFLSMKTTILSP